MITALLVASAGFVRAEPNTLTPSVVIRAETTVAAMPDRRYVFGLRPGRVLVWSALTGALIAEAPGGAAAFDNRSETAILGSELWDLYDRKKLAALGERGSVAGFSPDGRFAVTGRDEIQVWSLKLKAVVGRVTAARPRFVALADNAKFIALGRGEQFDVYDLLNGRLAKTGALAGVWPFRLKPTKGFSEHVDGRAVDFSVVYEQAEDPRPAGGNRPLYQVDWESRKSNIFAQPRVTGTGLSARAEGNDAVLSSSWDPSVEHAKLVGHSARVTEIAFSPDRWTAATGDASGEVLLWDVFDGKPLSQFRVEGGTITSLGFSPDAQFLLAGTRARLEVYGLSP